MVTTFSLRTGMTAAEILAELRGRVSGETQLEALQLFEETKDPEYAPPTHEIVLKDETNHALLLKREVRRDMFGKLTVVNRYYLSGINDEGAYFVHEVNIAQMAGHIRTQRLEDILAWVNRADEGFSHRIQGDVLMQYITFDRVRVQPGSSQADVQVPGISSFGWYKAQQPVQLGNHRISTEGTIYQSRDMLLVVGSKLIIQHPQHALVEKDILKNHAVLLAGQRGRNGVMGGGFD